jgi:hypothetical protein
MNQRNRQFCSEPLKKKSTDAVWRHALDSLHDAASRPLNFPPNQHSLWCCSTVANVSLRTSYRSPSQRSPPRRLQHELIRFPLPLPKVTPSIFGPVAGLVLACILSDPLGGSNRRLP